MTEISHDHPSLGHGKSIYVEPGEPNLCPHGHGPNGVKPEEETQDKKIPEDLYKVTDRNSTNEFGGII